MSKKLALIAAVLILSLAMSIAHAERPQQRSLFIAPGWVLPGAALDLDFAQGQYWVKESGCRAAAACLNVTRASVGTAQDNKGNIIQFSSGQPRITNQGLLIEESRTNSQPYNEMVGAAPPNVYPKGWQLLASGGIVVSVVGTGTENGIPYIDISLVGTTGGTSAVNIGFITPNTSVAASSGQTWTSSLFWRLSGGSLANIAGANLFVEMFNSSGTFVAQLAGVLSLPSAATLGLGRVSTTQTLNQAATAYIAHYLQIGWDAASLSINATFRIGGVQLEQGAFATSLIFTNGAAVTRAADFITVADPSAFGQAVTAYVLATPQAPTSYGTVQTPVQIDEGDNLQRIDIDRGPSSGALGGGITSNGTAWGAPGVAIWPQSAQWPVAYALQTNDQAMVGNGTLDAYEGQAEMFTPSRIVVGSDGNQVHQWNGTVARLAIWPSTRQPNAFLSAIAP